MLLTIAVSHEVEVEGQEDWKETTLEFEVEFTPGTRDTFCQSFGNWLPGDPDEVEVVSLRIDDRKATDEEFKKLWSLYENEVVERTYEEIGSRERER